MKIWYNVFVQEDETMPKTIQEFVLICLPVFFAFAFSLSACMHRVKKELRKSFRFWLISTLISAVFLVISGYAVYRITSHSIYYVVALVAMSIPLTAFCMLIIGFFNFITSKKKSASRPFWLFVTIAAAVILVFFAIALVVAIALYKSKGVI